MENEILTDVEKCEMIKRKISDFMVNYVFEKADEKTKSEIFCGIDEIYRTFDFLPNYKISQFENNIDLMFDVVFTFDNNIDKVYKLSVYVNKENTK